MELNITEFFNTATPSYYSASCADLGDNAGQITWANAIDAGHDWQLLKTPEHFEAMRQHALASGGWNEEEVSAWSDEELHALCLQWISGDIREGFDWPEEEREGLTEWEFYEKSAEAGRVTSSLFKTDDGQVYWTFGE